MTRMLIALSGGARISRRIVTHNHRRDFEALLADARTHFETLSQSPDDLLRHIGSPFAPDSDLPNHRPLPHDRLASMESVNDDRVSLR
jgi:hypothetical protein